MGLDLWTCNNCNAAFTEYEDSISCQKCNKEYCEDCQRRYETIQYYKCCVCKNNVEEGVEGEHICCFYDKDPKHICNSNCIYALYPELNEDHEDHEDRIEKALKEQRSAKIKCKFCNYSKKWVHNHTNKIMK